MEGAKMYQTWIEIGATPHAEAAHEFEHEATKKNDRFE